MIHDSKQFALGTALMVVFFAGLAALFAPLFANGGNALDYLDGVFNSISKASAYYIPGSIERAKKLEGSSITVKVAGKGAEQAREMEKLFTSAGATVAVDGTKLTVGGDLGRILAAAIADADSMFKNDGASVTARYGLDGRKVLFAWHTALGEAMKDLNRQAKFAEASAVRDSVTKSIEPAYNYFGVTAVPMKDMIGIAVVALVGYVVYTVWYGFAIMFLFEGLGLNLEH